MSEHSSRSGYVYTFYSYKGGVGRTMALANIGCLLARWSNRVLLVDWDLEAPGLEVFFEKAGILINSRADTDGIIDLLDACATKRELDWRDCLLKVDGSGVALDIISAGRGTEDYQRRLQGLDWATLFRKHRLGNYIDSLRREWRETYDFVLIDSRTGITDIGDICTILLPDALVLMFVSNYQSIDGIRNLMVRAREKRSRLPVDRSHLVGVPIPSRDEVYSEYDKSQEWKRIFANELGPFYRNWLPREVAPRSALEKLFIPYITNWSFGERLPIVESPTEIENPASISSAYARLATLLANGLDWHSLEKSTDPYELIEARSEKEAVLKETADLLSKQEIKYVRSKKRWQVAGLIMLILIVLSGGYIGYNFVSNRPLADKNSIINRANLQRMLQDPERNEKALATQLVTAVQHQQDLSGIDFSSAALEALNLNGGKFENAKFVKAKLLAVSLNGADLDGSSLVGADLKDAKLIRTSLVNADLKGADLRRADLTGADLTGASLSGALLTSAVFSRDTRFPKGVVPEDEYMIGLPSSVQSAQSEIVRLHGILYDQKECEESPCPFKAQISERAAAAIRLVRLYGDEHARLQNVNLAEANFKKAILTKADLKGAILSKTNFEGADLKGAILEAVNLSDAILTGADLEGVDLKGAILEKVDLEGANLSNAIITGANLKEALLESANLKNAHLDYVNLYGARLERADLEGANLERSTLIEAYLDDANLQSANMENAKLQRSHLYKTNLEEANLRGVDFGRADLRHAKFGKANLEKASLSTADFRYAKFRTASYSSNTKFPAGLDPKSLGMKMTD